MKQELFLILRVCILACGDGIDGMFSEQVYHLQIPIYFLFSSFSCCLFSVSCVVRRDGESGRKMMCLRF